MNVRDAIKTNYKDFVPVAPKNQTQYKPKTNPMRQIYPLAKTMGVINMDSLNVYGKTSDVVIIGLGNSDLDDFATQVAADQGRVIKSDCLLNSKIIKVYKYPAQLIILQSEHENTSNN